MKKDPPPQELPTQDNQPATDTFIQQPRPWNPNPYMPLLGLPDSPQLPLDLFPESDPASFLQSDPMALSQPPQMPLLGLPDPPQLPLDSFPLPDPASNLQSEPVASSQPAQLPVPPGVWDVPLIPADDSEERDMYQRMLEELRHIKQEVSSLSSKLEAGLGNIHALLSSLNATMAQFAGETQQ
ncbi:hypothetical protein VDGL01_11570 [Verticillium dahliae]